MAEELVEDPFQSALVFAFAHEAAELPFKRCPIAVILRFAHFRHTEVWDVAGRRIKCEDFAVGDCHGVSLSGQ